MKELNQCKWCEIVEEAKGEGRLEKLAGGKFAVFCNRCGWFTDSYDTEQQAIDAWNKRS